MDRTELIEQLRVAAQEADELHERSRLILVGSARRGIAEGLTQREVSAAIGRSQPEVSRLVRFHGRTPLGDALERNRVSILKLLSRSGARNVRVFGSVSRGEDVPGSDVDLMVDFERPIGLFSLSRLEAQLEEIVGAAVDVVSAVALREAVAERAVAEAVPL